MSYPKMTALARTFHGLDEADGVEPFDPVRLDEWACSGVPSHGALYAAQFVLAVFHGRGFKVQGRARRHEQDGYRWPVSSAWRCGPFDLVDALGTWDHAHRNAFLAWAKEPWWP